MFLCKCTYCIVNEAIVFTGKDVGFAGTPQPGTVKCYYMLYTCFIFLYHDQRNQHLQWVTAPAYAVQTLGDSTLNFKCPLALELEPKCGKNMHQCCAFFISSRYSKLAGLCYNCYQLRL